MPAEHLIDWTTIETFQDACAFAAETSFPGYDAEKIASGLAYVVADLQGVRQDVETRLRQAATIADLRYPRACSTLNNLTRVVYDAAIDGQFEIPRPSRLLNPRDYWTQHIDNFAGVCVQARAVAVDLARFALHYWTGIQEITE